MRDVVEVSVAVRGPRLSDCPFCGSKADYFSGVGLVWVKCINCGVETRGRISATEAAEKWNQRKPAAPSSDGKGE